MAHTQFGKQVKVVIMDNESEFKSGPIKVFYRDKKIIHQTSCVDTPQKMEE